MATEEKKIVSSESLGFKEREKIENPAELLQNSISGLDKFGGFQLLKGLIKGVENMDPRRKAVKSIFLSDSTYSDARKRLTNELSLWIEILEKGGDPMEIIDSCKAECEKAEENFPFGRSSAKALEILTAKKNIRLLELPNLADSNKKGLVDMKKVAGGLLVQELDTELLNEEDIVCVTDRKPTEEEMKQLMFVWKVVKHTKSNGIALAKDNATTGIGPGQTNRITALELAIKYAGDKAAGSVMGSDAFFPFDDCVKAAQAAGITAIIQPGGSIRDEDSIKACNEAGIAMVFCGMRHFKH